MISGKTVWRRFRTLWRIDEFECEITAELNFHIEMRTLDNIETGMLPEVAREDALKRFGDIQKVQDACQQILRDSLFERLAKSLHPYLWGLGICGCLLRFVGHMLFPVNGTPALQHVGDLMIVIAILAELYIFLKDRRSQHSISEPKKNIFPGDGD